MLWIMIMFLMFTVSLEQISIPRKITGIPSQPQDVLLLEFRPKIDLQKMILIKETQNFDSLIKLAQNLIQNNIATSRTIASRKVNDLKQSIVAAKEEAKYASTDIKICISRQEYEIPKLYMPPPLTCYANYTDMIEVKNKLLKLQIINGQLVSNYQQLYMDDCEKDITLFRRSLAERIADIYKHIDRIKIEFDVSFGNVITDSLKCLIEGNFETFKNIGSVMNSLKNCKNVFRTRSISNLRHVI